MGTIITVTIFLTAFFTLATIVDHIARRTQP